MEMQPSRNNSRQVSASNISIEANNTGVANVMNYRSKMMDYIKKKTPEKQMSMIETKKLILIRKWLQTVTALILIFSLINATAKEDRLPIWM